MKKIKAKIIERTIDGENVKILRLGFKAELKVIDDQDDRWIIEGYASVFGNVDSYYEIVEKGAFSEFIAKHPPHPVTGIPRYPKLIWAHDWSKPLGPTLEVREDEYGLYVKGELLKDVAQAREAYALIKAGAMTDFSFGFRVREDEFDHDTGYRHLKKIDIFEWSPVLVGANPEAGVTGVKSVDGEPITEIPVEAIDNQVPEEITPEEAPEETPTEPETPVEGGDESDTASETPVPEETPTDAATETGEPTGENDTTAPDGGEKSLEEKKGRVLSSKNRKSIETAIDEMRNAINTLEALLEATDEDDGKSSSSTGETGHSDRNVIKAILKDARRADQVNEKIILRVKSIL